MSVFTTERLAGGERLGDDLRASPAGGRAFLVPPASGRPQSRRARGDRPRPAAGVNRDGRARVSLLPQPVPLSSVAHLIPDTVPVTEVLRLAAPCAERGASQFAAAHLGDGQAVTVIAAAIGLAALLMFFALHRQSKVAMGWPATPAKIVTSGAESCLS
jgi:hypothetical protein